MASRNKNIDVVYVLGSGSYWRNNEIRFSLRALDKNLRGIRKIWIVGEYPDFVKGINHIPFKDELLNNADGNIIRKVLRICQESEVSSNFLFMNDDHLIMKEVHAGAIPPYHKGDLSTLSKEYFGESPWRGHLFNSRNVLTKLGYKALHFDCHVPMIISKEKFPQVMSKFDFEKTPYTMKSLYGNIVHPEAPKMKGEKVTLFRPYSQEDIRKKTHGRSFVAYNDDGLKIALKIWLYQHFPEKSKYEKSADDPYFDLVKWVLSPDKDFKSGCELYDKYGLSKRTRKYMSRGESKVRYLKLEHKLKELLNYY